MRAPRPLLPLLSLLALLLAAAPLGAQAAGSVRGVVRSEQSATPLGSAMVELVVEGERRAVAADPTGRYRLVGVSPGRRLVRASHVGHAPLEIEVVVPAGREVEVNFSLPIAPVALAPVEVEAGGGRAAVDTAAAAAAEVGLATARAVQGSPGLAELGLGETAPGEPGNDPADPTDVLYVRGAASDLKLVYLDGAPIYAPFPLGGLLDTFTPGLLGSANVYLGGAPARYDGGLSYVLDLRTRAVRPDQVRSEGAVDLLSGRALLEAPLGSRAGVLAAGRSVHGLGSVEPLPYDYREGVARADLRLGDDALLTATGFANDERVWLAEGHGADSAVAWGNASLALRFRGTVAGQPAEVTASAGDYHARLPLPDGRGGRVAEGRATRLRFAADLSARAGGVALDYGASLDRLEQRYRARDAGGVGRWTAAVGDAAGAYADAAWQPARRLSLRGGLRLDYFSLGQRLVAAPRLSGTWLASDRAALTLAVGRYHQYLRAPEDALVSASVDAFAARSLQPLAVGGSSHLALRLDQDLGEQVRLGIEGFHKSFEGMPGAANDRARSSGVDVWVRRDAGALTGWLGYSLAWVWSDSEGTDTEQFAGRQLLTSGLALPLGERSRLDLRFAYGSGLPYSAIPLSENVDAPPLPGTRIATRGSTAEALNGGAGAAPLLPSPDRPYLRLDLGGSHTWTQRWLGRPTAISTYAKLLNTLGRRDALFYRYDRDEDRAPRGIAALPLVPVVGLEWKF